MVCVVPRLQPATADSAEADCRRADAGTKRVKRAAVCSARVSAGPESAPTRESLDLKLVTSSTQQQHLRCVVVFVVVVVVAGIYRFKSAALLLRVRSAQLPGTPPVAPTFKLTKLIP